MLNEEIIYGKLDLFVELSREEKSLVTEGRKLTVRKSRKRYIDALLREEGNLIRDLAAPLEDGGRQASVYICGNSDFFKTVRTALDKIDPGMVSRLVQSRRLQLEVQARGDLQNLREERTLRLTDRFPLQNE